MKKNGIEAEDPALENVLFVNDLQENLVMKLLLKNIHIGDLFVLMNV